MSAPLLWQYNFSNFNEKVRWALDYKRIPHRRHSLLPGSPRALAMSRGGGTIPVLELDGERIVDSTPIIAALESRFPDPPLYPAGEAERQRALELEDFFDENAGHELRRVGFYEWADNPRFAVGLLTTGQSRLAKRWTRLMFSVAMSYARRRYRIYPADVEESRVKLGAVLDRIEAERAGGDYLVGDSFSVADLTACALLYPLAFMRGVKFHYDYPELPESGTLNALSEHPGADWIAETYRRHRGESAEIAK